MLLGILLGGLGLEEGQLSLSLSLFKIDNGTWKAKQKHEKCEKKCENVILFD